MAPKFGHMEALKRVFDYLRCKYKGQLLIDIDEPPVRDTNDTGVLQDWKEFYPNAAENIPKDRPEPREKLCTMTCYVDADYARDVVTRKSVKGILLLLN